MNKSQSLTIGIDGNEANIENRVGVNQFAHGLLFGLWRQNTKHRFVIYLSSPPLPSLPKEKENWHYRVFGPPKFWTQWRLPLDLFTRNPKPDVFFSPSHYAPRFSPVPTVVSIMDLGFLSSQEQFTRKDYFQLREWTNYSVRNASHIVTISEFSKIDIQKNYNIPAGKISVVYPGYDKELFPPKSSQETSPRLIKYGIKQPYILFLSSLKPSKNVERLIEAFAKVIKSDKSPSKINLVIAGKKAWLFDQIFARVKALRIEKRVVFTGFFPEIDIPYLVAGANVFVLPSLFEGFGIPAVEAMASKVPVVISNVASLPEAAGPAGIYINPLSSDDIAKGLKYALSLPRSKREKIVQDGVKFAHRFDWGIASTKILSILENVIF